MLSSKLLETLRSYWRAVRPEEVAVRRPRGWSIAQQERRGTRLQKGSPPRRYPQAHNTAFDATRVRRASAGIGYRQVPAPDAG